MKITGERLLPAPLETVWDSLFDPAVLALCVPGCESLEREDSGRYLASVVMAIGPLKAKFSGHLDITDIVEQKSCTLLFEGAGGAAGMAKGVAEVQLEATPDGTCLRYEADAKISGKLAQVGARLIDSVAKKLAAQFFTRFEETVAVASK